MEAENARYYNSRCHCLGRSYGRACELARVLRGKMQEEVIVLM